MNDNELLLILSDPKQYTEKLQALKAEMVAVDIKLKEVMDIKHEIFQKEKENQALLDQVNSKLNEVKDIQYATVNLKADLDNREAKFLTFVDGYHRREDEVRRKEEELKQRETEVEHKHREATHMFQEGSSLKRKYEDKLNRLTSVING